jgi:hypothetical protein
MTDDERRGQIRESAPPDDLTLEERLQWLMAYWQRRDAYEGEMPCVLLALGRREVWRMCINELRRVLAGETPWNRHEYDEVWRRLDGSDTHDDEYLAESWKTYFKKQAGEPDLMKLEE